MGINENRLANYYKVYRAIAEHPTMSIYDIGVHTEISRNAASKYLKEMYERIREKREKKKKYFCCLITV